MAQVAAAPQATMGKVPLPTLLTTDAALNNPQISRGSPRSSVSPSPGPFEGTPAQDLDRPLTPSSANASHNFVPQPSTREQPETQSPLTLRGHRCVRTGLCVSTAAERLAEGVPLGTRLFAHRASNSLLSTAPNASPGRSRSPLLRLGSGDRTPTASNDPGSPVSGGPAGLGPIESTVTAGPTLLIGTKPCVLIPSPMGEKRWRENAQAIIYQWNKQCKGDSAALKMSEKAGKYLDPLRDHGTRSRKNSIASSFMTHLNVSMLSSPVEKSAVAVKAGRVWICSMGCEGATGKKRDWALVELDPNVVGTGFGARVVESATMSGSTPAVPVEANVAGMANSDNNGAVNGELPAMQAPQDQQPVTDVLQRRNIVVIGGKAVRLSPPSAEGAKVGTRVVLATAGSRSIPLGGVVGEREKCLYAYDEVQRITLDRDNVLAEGDAGACVIDEASGMFYGILVMVGSLARDTDDKAKEKKNGGRRASASPSPSRTSRATAWFVPYDVIVRDICTTYPIDVIQFAE